MARFRCAVPASRLVPTHVDDEHLDDESAWVPLALEGTTCRTSREPVERPWIAWDDRLTGFGVRIHPAGTRTFIVDYRAGNGGRKAPNKRVSLGRYGAVTVDQVRRRAQEILGRAAGGNDPAAERAEARCMPTLGEAFEDYMGANPGRSKPPTSSTATRRTAIWATGSPVPSTGSPAGTSRPASTPPPPTTAGRRPTGPCRCCARSTAGPASTGTACATRSISGPPAGGRFHRRTRRKISAPAEVLPCWRKGIEAEVHNPVIRDALWFGLYTGMRREEVLTLRCVRVDMRSLTFRVEETKTGTPLELPVTRQLAGILERRRAAAGDLPADVREWVFPSRAGATGHVQDPHHLYGRISEAGGAKFWFHGLRNCFITVAGRELMLPPSLTERLVNHARPSDVTEGYVADWTVNQLREPGQRIADRIEALMDPTASSVDAA